MESTGGETEEGCGGQGRERGLAGGGPSLGSPIASELANTITIHLHPHPPPHTAPFPSWETSPLTGPPLKWTERVVRGGGTEERSWVKSPSPRTKMTRKGKDRDRDWQTARDIQRQANRVRYRQISRSLSTPYSPTISLPSHSWHPSPCKHTHTQCHFIIGLLSLAHP